MAADGLEAACGQHAVFLPWCRDESPHLCDVTWRVGCFHSGRHERVWPPLFGPLTGWLQLDWKRHVNSTQCFGAWISNESLQRPCRNACALWELAVI